MNTVTEGVKQKLVEYFGTEESQANSDHPDALTFFYRSIEMLSQHHAYCDYLEIGSFNGVSMAVVSLMLRHFGLKGQRVSIDPYFEEGYMETHPHTGEKALKPATGEALDRAMKLYKGIGEPIQVLRKTSEEIAPNLITAGQKFNMIFIDGNHEQLHPMLDVAFSKCLLSPKSLLLLDDCDWPDVQSVKNILDKHARLLFEVADKSAYFFE